MPMGIEIGGIGERTGALIKDITGEDVLNQRLSYLMKKWDT